MLSELGGIKDQPELKGFFIASNNLSTLAGFPNLPKLEHLRIDGNPVLYQATGKLCALVVAGERIEKLDGQAVCHQYLLEKQKLSLAEMIPAPPCRLKDIHISGSNEEGADITVDFVFECEEHIHHDDANSAGLLTGTMNYQWHRGERGGFFTIIQNAISKDNEVEEPIEGSEGKRVYYLAPADMGCTIGFRYIPVRDDGVEGESSVVYAGSIKEEQIEPSPRTTFESPRPVSESPRLFVNGPQKQEF